MPDAAPAATSRDVQCLSCRYPLRDLPEHRCPECGRTFDPADPTTIYVPTLTGFLIRHFVRPAGFAFYAWPTLAMLLMVVSKWYPAPRPWVPLWVSVLGFVWRLDVWGLGVCAWGVALLLWTLRLRARRRIAAEYPSLRDRLRREKWPRRFACACFIFGVLFGPYETDRCSHGEFWRCGSVGVARETVNAREMMGEGFGYAHAFVWVPLPGRWLIYWNRPF